MKSPFRAIRQKLFTEGKLVRYLGYAVGEILLIIIGIMIALELNNWNADRKAQVEFEEYIVQLKEDVKQTISGLKTVVDISEARTEKTRYVLRFLKQEDVKEGELANFESALSNLWYISFPQIHVGLVGRLMDGDFEVINRSKDLSQHAFHMQSEAKKNIEIIESVRMGAGSQVGVLSKYVGDRLPEDPEMRMLYNVDELKSSTEFLYATRNVMARASHIGILSDRVIGIFEDFLAVLEEYE